MLQTIDPERLRQVRKLRGLSREALAGKAKLAAKTIYRFEREEERKSIREANLERLAGALKVEREVLTGDKPVPPSIHQQSGSVEESAYQINVRVGAAIRNAFSLVALRYNISVPRIVELAPLLFVLAAEGSLKRRRDKLPELAHEVRETLSKVELSAREHFPHLPIWDFGRPHNLDEIVEAEERSIDASDIFGSEISGKAFDFSDPDFDEEEDNPFVGYLREIAKPCDEVSIEAFGPKRTRYEVCRGQARELAGEDEGLAKALQDGSVLIHKIPRELLESEAAAQRVEWIRAKVEEHRKEINELVNRALSEDKVASLDTMVPDEHADAAALKDAPPQEEAKS